MQRWIKFKTNVHFPILIHPVRIWCLGTTESWKAVAFYLCESILEVSTLAYWHQSQILVWCPNFQKAFKYLWKLPCLSIDFYYQGSRQEHLFKLGLPFTDFCVSWYSFRISFILVFSFLILKLTFEEWFRGNTDWTFFLRRLQFSFLSPFLISSWTKTFACFIASWYILITRL